MAMPRRKPRPPRHPNTLQACFPVTIQAAAHGGAEGAPVQRRFSLIAYTGEPLQQWWSDAPIVVDLAGVDLTAQRMPILYDHCASIDTTVGQSESVRIDGGRLVADGVLLTESTPMAAQIAAKADEGLAWQSSIGADIIAKERFEAGQSVSVNGRTYAGPVIVARRVVLREISFVILGADRFSSALVASRLKGVAMSFEEWLTSLGFEDQTSLTPVQLANLQMLYNEETGGETEETPAEDAPAEPSTPSPAPAAAAASAVPLNLQAQRQQAAIEASRINEIGRICATAGNPRITVGNQTVDAAAHAIQAGWTAEQTRQQVELHQLRAERTNVGPYIAVHGRDRDMTADALSAAVLLRAGGRIDRQHTNRRLPQWLRAGVNDATRNKIMDAAHNYAGMSMIDLLRASLSLEGRQLSSYDRGETIQAAFSSASLTNIFTTSVNALLFQSYEEAPDTTGVWTREVEVADFKTNERLSLAKGSALRRLPRGGEADHTTRSDRYESYKIARYAQQFQVDEQDIIDDSLGAIEDMPQEMGLAAARLRPDLVYGTMLANPTLNATSRALFNATDGNLNTSAALTSTTLKAAVSDMRLFTDNGVNLNIRPTHILVPPTLRHPAMELINSSTIIIAGTAGSVTERGSLNSLQSEGLQIIDDARLENGVTRPDNGTTYSGSSTTWWLISTMARTMEVAYLRGTGRAPVVRSAPLTMGKYGINWDVCLDIGVCPLDWRGFHQNTA